jgi:hypothetical protein
MPIDIEVDEARQLTVLTVVGEVSFVEMRRAIETFWETDEPTLDVLWDYRRADMSQLALEDHEALVRIGLKYSDRHAERTDGRTAIVASRDLEYGMNRASEALTQLEGYPFQIKTFRTAEEAEAWLAEARD